MSYDEEALYRELVRDEGKRLTPYQDSLGYWTVGIGHLLPSGESRQPISEAQCRDYFINDVIDAENRLNGIMPGWRALSDVRQRALVNLSFNLGGKLARFKQFLAAMEREEYVIAGQHLQASLWAKQVKLRAARIIHMIATGTPWPL